VRVRAVRKGIRVSKHDDVGDDGKTAGEQVHLLVDIDALDLPTGSVEVGRIKNALGASAGAATLGISIVGPTAAESDVQDNLLLLNDIGGLAVAGAGERGAGDTPCCRIRLGSRDISRNRAAGEPPNLGAGGVNEESKDGAAGSVEPLTIRCRVGVLETAASVRVLGACASLGHKVGADILDVDVARCAARAWTSVQGHLVYGSVVDAFDNVDLPVVRPVGSNSPESRPDRATVWHSDDIEDHQSGTVRVLRRDADRVTVLSGLKPSGRVHFDHGNTIILNIGKAFAHRIVLGLVVDQAAGRVRASEKVPLVEERLPRESFIELVLAWGNGGCGYCGCRSRFGRGCGSANASAATGCLGVQGEVIVTTAGRGGITSTGS